MHLNSEKKMELIRFKTQIHILGQGVRRLLKCFHFNPVTLCYKLQHFPEAARFFHSRCTNFLKYKNNYSSLFPLFDLWKMQQMNTGNASEVECEIL